MPIEKVTRQQSYKMANRIAEIIRTANKTVAKDLQLTLQNAPSHPSFYTAEQVLADFKRGEEYFIYYENNIAVGCVAFEQKSPEKAYLNRLAVLPDYRNKGIGSALVNKIIDYAEKQKVKLISIGIIDGYTILENWYFAFGFEIVRRQSFAHLPFDVMYMQYRL